MYPKHIIKEKGCYKKRNKLNIKIFAILLLLLTLSQTVSSQLSKSYEDAKRYIHNAETSYNIDTVKKYAEITYKIAKVNNDTTLLIRAINNLAWSYTANNTLDSAIVLYLQLLEYAEKSNNLKQTALTYCNLGICEKNTGNYTEMWKYFNKGLQIYTKLCDTIHICWATRSMGMPYEHFGMYDEARKMYQKALELSQISNNQQESAISIYRIANCTQIQYTDSLGNDAIDKFIKIKQQFFESYNIIKNSDESLADTYASLIIAMSRCYIKLANLLYRNDYTDSSKNFLNIYTANFPNDKDSSRILESKLLTCETNVYEKNYTLAIQNLEKLLQLPYTKTQTLQNAEICRLLAVCYKATGNVRKEFDNSKKYFELIGKSHNDENMKRVSNFASQIDIEQERQKQEIYQQRQTEIYQKETLRQRILYVILATTAILFVAVAVLFAMFLSKRRKYNILLNARNEKLSAQRKELAIQRDAEETAKSIMIGSVEYAYNIQTETIGNVKKVKDLFPESFVYYQPRDIVSGDWYYATEVNGCRLISNADCTGHGIPGALLCILGVSTLKEIINKIEAADTPVMPGEILDKMRTSIKKSLNKNTESKSSKVDDGMDMTILVFPPEGSKIHFASANQSAILIHDGNATRLKGDSNPIGNYIREIDNFTTITTNVSKGDGVYIFSDGIQDQVGGPNIRKYTLKKIINLLLENYQLPMQQQMEVIKSDINKWTNGITQVDDRSMIGIRIDQ